MILSWYNIKYQILNIKYWKLNIWYLISNIKYCLLKKHQKHGSLYLGYSIYIIKSKPKYFPIYNSITFENSSIDRFLTGIFDFVELYFLVEVSRALKFSVNFTIIHKDKWGCDFQSLVRMKIICIQLKATEIWVPCPRGSLENLERVSQAHTCCLLLVKNKVLEAHI